MRAMGEIPVRLSKPDLALGTDAANGIDSRTLRAKLSSQDQPCRENAGICSKSGRAAKVLISCISR